MRRLLPKTLFGQLVLGTVLVQTLFLGAFIWYTVVSQRRIAQEKTHERVAHQLSLMSAAIAPPLAKGDSATVHSMLELSKVSAAIEVARLTDLKGVTIAVSDSGRHQVLDNDELATIVSARHEQKIFIAKNGQTESVTPVLEHGEPVALLWLEPNHSVSLTTANALVRVSLTYGVFALLANIIPIFLIVRTITRPLRRLREATQHITSDSELAGFPLPITTQTEVGDLTTSFNTMVQELREQRSGLLQTVALLDSMLQNAPIGFAFFDRELHLIRVSEFVSSSDQNSGRKHTERSGTRFFPDSIARQASVFLRRVFDTGDAIRDVEITGSTTDEPETSRTWLMHFYPVSPEPGAVQWVGVILVEITDRLQAEETLRKTEKLAAAGRLAASIAHEVNNPLESVTNLLYLLRSHASLDSEASGYVETAQSELARVSEITQQTLRFYRQSTLPSNTNIAEVLDSLLLLYQSRLASLHVTVVKKYQPHAEVFGFNGELRQLFANLITNAADAMNEHGHLFLRVRRGSGPGPNGGWAKGVRVSVSDNGSGMSEKTARRIFEAFFTTKDKTGTGLGLWVSEEIIQKHSGTMRVRSRQGEHSGTCFMLFLPDGGLANSSPQIHSENPPVAVD